MRGILALILASSLSLGWVATSTAQVIKTIGEIERLDPALDDLLPQDASIEVLGKGFEWSEGPVWVEDGLKLLGEEKHGNKFVLFSDIPNNRIMKWKEGNGVTLFMKNSGYTGQAPFTGEEPGSNGLTLDHQGRLVRCEHGNRRITRLNPDPPFQSIVLAEQYNGKRFNSPNDLIYKSNGDLYFTDPPYGLPKRYDDPARELDWCGVYRLQPDGTVTLLTKEMSRPNGIGFSPDEKTLYIAQSDSSDAIYKAFPVKDDGTLGSGSVLFDATKWMGDRPGAPDGMAIDVNGNLWATGPGGVLILSPQGKLLGRISTGERTANCCFGNDGSTLYITADMYFCRVQTKTKGIGF